MCHLLEQLNLTLGLGSWALTDPGHFLWIWISSEHKYSGAGLLLAQIMPLLAKQGPQTVDSIDSEHSLVGSVLGFILFFFPWHLEPISLPGSQPSTQREKVRETDGQAHKSIEWVPTKFDRNFAGRRRGKRIRKMSKFLSLLAVNIFAKYWQMNLSSV